MFRHNIPLGRILGIPASTPQRDGNRGFAHSPSRYWRTGKWSGWSVLSWTPPTAGLKTGRGKGQKRRRREMMEADNDQQG